ncbi:MAG TPA: hypothetical protein VHU91_07080 [Mycobacteriales bacterium]|nr:hypothetical protein [Mycobacteriales bacterium]
MSNVQPRRGIVWRSYAARQRRIKISALAEALCRLYGHSMWHVGHHG